MDDREEVVDDDDDDDDDDDGGGAGAADGAGEVADDSMLTFKQHGVPVFGVAFHPNR